MRNKGFTLVELLVVVAIIGILATIVISSLGSARMKAKDTAIVGELRNLQTSIEVITGATGTYTDICDEMEAGGELALFRESVESKGGIWQDCQSDVNSYSVVVTLNSGQLADNSFLGTTAFAQEKQQMLGGEGSADALLLSDADVDALRDTIRKSGERFSNPRYYCVGAVPPRTSEGNFRRGYLYTLPNIGCGTPVTSPDELLAAYVGEEEEEVDAQAIITSFSCPVTAGWQKEAAAAVKEGVITQVEVDALVDSCDESGDGVTPVGQTHLDTFACPASAEWMKRATELVGTRDLTQSAVDALIKSCDQAAQGTQVGAAHASVFKCPVDAAWLKRATELVGTGDMTQQMVDDLVASCEVKITYEYVVAQFSCPVPNGWNKIANEGMLAGVITQAEVDNLIKSCSTPSGNYTRHCSAEETRYPGTFTGCGDKINMVWVESRLCDHLPTIDCSQR